jgi:MFS transporter, FLVCR family, feline leukemia virus subgroup C receptor-related protein
MISFNTDIQTESNLIQVTVKRWFILAIFSFITFINAFNWIGYNIIQDVTIAFYNESLPVERALQNDAVNWLSMVYMLGYVILIFPAMFLVENKGIKLSCILGALITTLGKLNE